MNEPRNSETAWTFYTAHFRVRAFIVPDDDAEEPDNFGVIVQVEYAAQTAEENEDRWETRAQIVGTDSLWGCDYDPVSDFFESHRDRDPMNRNCTMMRQARGGSPDAAISICHYFPGMVSEAIADARRTLRATPYVRAA